MIPPLLPIVPPPVAPLVPAPIQQQAVIPPIPLDPVGAFAHVLEHVIGLDTQAKRDSVTITAGCQTADDLMYVQTESLINCLDPATSIIAKTRLKTMKKWVEDSFDINGSVDISSFTADVCRVNQRAIACTPNQDQPKQRSQLQKRN
jgi:hypothetical protein